MIQDINNINTFYRGTLRLRPVPRDFARGENESRK